MSIHNLKLFLEEKVKLYNHPSFIENDPISIPHLFTKKQDIEISALFTAVLAWGQRKTIINKGNELIGLMDHAPHEFILGHSENDLKQLTRFKHRTFNATDTLYFIHFLKQYYEVHETLETLFIVNAPHENMETALIRFHDTFFSLEEAPIRTQKHIPTPLRRSACKRINMFLRWMVRKDDSGVDFGIWDRIKMDQLICPIDLHVDRVARRLGLITRKQTDWLTALELTKNLHELNPADPVRYDFALFGLGVLDKPKV